MAKLTRRGFFGQTTASVATIGVLAVVPQLAATSDLPDTSAAALSIAELSAADLAGPLVAHVSDLASGEVSLLVGTQEIIFRDPELVMRLLNMVR
jgi:hypothetical protein